MAALRTDIARLEGELASREEEAITPTEASEAALRAEMDEALRERDLAASTAAALQGARTIGMRGGGRPGCG